MLETTPRAEKLACAICGNLRDNHTHLAREMMLGLRDEFRYLECGHCRCVYLIDVPADMSKYYPENYYSFVPAGSLETAIENRRAAYAHGKWSPTGWLSHLLLGPHPAMTAIRRARIPADARVLDVGCGAGWLIRRMKHLGYQHVSGIDPYIESDVRLSDGVVVLRRSLQEMAGEFDVIMFHHSFEHIPDQADALRQVRRLLHPAGRVLIRIPVADSFAWRHYGVNWVHLDAPRHFFLHSPKSLRLLAEQCGLHVAKLAYEGNAGQFVASEKYAKNIALVDQRSGGAPQQLLSLWRARRYRDRAAALNRTSEGDWACFELKAQQTNPA
jgi:SAM-dependent methyltransferase